jgi:hypothetical protein
LIQKNVEGKLEGMDPTQEGKDHAKDSTNLYERVQAGSSAAGPNEQETLSTNVICQVKKSVCQITCHEALRSQLIASAT